MDLAFLQDDSSVRQFVGKGVQIHDFCLINFSPEVSRNLGDLDDPGDKLLTQFGDMGDLQASKAPSNA